MSQRSPSFVLANGQAAQFIFVGLDGVLSAWNPPMGRNAIVVKNNVGQTVYTGLALSDDKSSGTFLYAANALKGTVDVLD